MFLTETNWKWNLKCVKCLTGKIVRCLSWDRNFLSFRDLIEISQTCRILTETVKLQVFKLMFIV